MTIQEYVASPETRQAMCFATIDGQTPVGPFRNVFALYLKFNEKGDKVDEVYVPSSLH